jgi:short-subunit dehydrogenase
MMKKMILITGASSGIGKDCAKLFANKGFQVIATTRNVERMKDLEKFGCYTLPMDVTNEDSIQNAFGAIYEKVSIIDKLVNKAGYSQNGFVEELTLEHLRYQIEVNVFGLIRFTQMVSQNRRAAKRGTIINIGSVGEDFTSAGASAYNASKYALESFTEGMRQELAHFGIKVVLIKPGEVETDFVKNSDILYPKPMTTNSCKKMIELPTYAFQYDRCKKQLLFNFKTIGIGTGSLSKCCFS